MNRDLLRAYALRFVGCPYRFGTAQGGGDDPVMGFDCSGLVSELLRACGVVAWNFRGSAQVLAGLPGTRALGPGEQPDLGDLVFFGASMTQISHVGFCLDGTTMLEAGGGDSSTTTPEAAAERNAFVRLRPIHFRKDFLGVVRLAYPFPLT